MLHVPHSQQQSVIVFSNSYAAKWWSEKCEKLFSSPVYHLLSFATLAEMMICKYFRSVIFDISLSRIFNFREWNSQPLLESIPEIPFNFIPNDCDFILSRSLGAARRQYLFPCGVLIYMRNRLPNHLNGKWLKWKRKLNYNYKFTIRIQILLGRVFQSMCTSSNSTQVAGKWHCWRSDERLNIGIKYSLCIPGYSNCFGICDEGTLIRT